MNGKFIGGSTPKCGSGRQGSAGFTGAGRRIVCSLLFAAANATAQTTWKTATDGDWNTPGNWSDDVPNNNVANLTASGGSYTVTVNATPAGPYTDLTVQNADDDTTTLAVNADGLKSNDGLITIGRGATVLVNDGGGMEYDGSDSTKTIVEVKDGGVWHVDDGTVAFTNLYPGVNTARRIKTLSIGGVNSAGTLRISSGSFVYTYPEFGADGNPGDYVVNLAVGGANGSQGLLEMTGGYLNTASMPQFGNGQTLYVGTGVNALGQVMLYNDASMVMSNGFYIGGSRITTGTGEMVVADNATVAVYTPSGGRNVIGSGPNSVGTLTVKNNASFEVFTAVHNTLGGNRNNHSSGTGIINVMDNATVSFNTLNLGTAAIVGTTAYGVVNLSGGRMTLGETTIGHAHRTDTTGIGVMNVSGGELTFTHNLTVGHTAAVGGFATGTLNLSGGVVSNAVGYTYISMSPTTTGVVHQVAGNFVIDSTLATRSMYVGYGGGDGTYRISGGVFSSRATVFVGGVTGGGAAGSLGLLEVTGGSFGVTNAVTVGQNGTGRVEIGAAGALYASSLTLQGATSTLRFECGPAGVGSCTVAGELTVGSGAKLEVDASLFEPDSTTELVLAQYGSRSAPFAAGDITLVTGSRSAEILQSDTRIVLRVSGTGGTLVAIR